MTATSGFLWRPQEGDAAVQFGRPHPRATQSELLFLEPWFQSPKFNRSQGGYAYTRFPYVVNRVIVLVPEDVHWAHTSVPVLSSDLTRFSTPKQTIETIKSYLKSRKDPGPALGATTALPPDLRGGYHEVAFTVPVDAEIDTFQSMPRLTIGRSTTLR